jgi:phage-related protein
MKIEFYRTDSGREPVKDYLKNLQKYERVEVARVLEKIRVFGFNAAGTQFRQIRGKLWEIKISESKIFYLMIETNLMVLLHAYKKQSRKLPFKERMVAIERMKKLLW